MIIQVDRMSYHGVRDVLMRITDNSLLQDVSTVKHIQTTNNINDIAALFHIIRKYDLEAVCPELEVRIATLQIAFFFCQRHDEFESERRLVELSDVRKLATRLLPALKRLVSFVNSVLHGDHEFFKWLIARYIRDIAQCETISSQKVYDIPLTEVLKPFIKAYQR